MNPLYRIKLSVYDDQTGEEIAHIDEPVFDQDNKDTDALVDANQPSFFRMMRKYVTERDDFEKTHYPKDDDHE